MTTRPSLTIPPDTADTTGLCEALSGAIRAAIAHNGGWIGFDRYMELALYAPGLG